MSDLKQRIIFKKVEQELKLKDGKIFVNKSSCDGCGNCVDSCPQAAIVIVTLTNEEIKKLSFKGRIKVKIKGKNKADINPDLCIACGLCIKQCHEFAIHKVKIENN